MLCDQQRWWPQFIEFAYSKRIYEKTFLGYCHKALCITLPTRLVKVLDPTGACQQMLDIIGKCPIWLFLIIYIIFVSFYFQYALGLFDWMLYQYPIVLFFGRIAVVWIYRWQWKNPETFDTNWRTVIQIGSKVAHWNKLKMERSMMLLTCRKLRCNDSANVPFKGCQI